MKIISINGIPNNKIAATHSFNLSSSMGIPAFMGSNIPSEVKNTGYGTDLFYMCSMNKLKEETQTFPKDIEYRKQLLINAGLNPENPHKIRSIIGPQEIEKLISEFDNNETVYSSGENFENVLNHKMRANIHMHTIASDGALSVQELLDKSTKYANQVVLNNPTAQKAPFIVAITDHDTIESAQKAIKIISENPLKYRNLRVILGVEMTTYNNIATNLINKPTNTHVLVFGIDPNEATFKTFIDGVKAKKRNLEIMMVDTANKIYKQYYGKDNFFSLSQAKSQYNQLNKDIVGIYNNLDAYFQNKIAIENIVLKNKTIISNLKKHKLPTNTDGFMEQMREFRYKLDRNNRVVKPIDALPEFISVCAKMEKDNVTQIISEGLNQGIISDLNNSLQESIAEYKVTLKPKYDYMPTFETLYAGLSRQKQAVMGIAHPIDTTGTIKNSEDKYAFLKDLYDKFKQGCKEKAKFSEVYYQSYKPERKAFKENPVTQVFMNTISKFYKLYKTGSQDTHGLNIFRR